MTAWAILEIRGDQAHVRSAPDLDELAVHLERVDPNWSLTWGCDSVSPCVVRARLSVLGTVREGLATAPSLADAKLAALGEAARLYGVAPATEGHWVEYDPEDGPNTADLESDPRPESAARPAQLSPEPPRDPQMEKARQHIEDLIEQLKVVGKNKEAARILMRGYGETVEESRAIYKELSAILKG